MPKLLDLEALGQSVQASKDYTDQRITDVEITVQQATAEEVQDILDDVFGDLAPVGTYITFDSDAPRTITPTYTNSGITLQYSLNKKKWVDITSKTAIPSAKTIYMRGQATGTKGLFTSHSNGNTWKFSDDETNKLRVTGNLNYLLCDTLGDLIAPTLLAKYCYDMMFTGCTSLTTAPALPTTTLTVSCYQSMFSECTSLVTAPELPATTLADSCYYSMFKGCTSLVNAPALPATTLADSCYNCMFLNCTSLINAPELPATTLADSCYEHMFAGCTSLSSVTIYATTDLTMFRAFYMMLNNVSPSGILTCNLSVTTALLPTPAGWTRVNF